MAAPMKVTLFSPANIFKAKSLPFFASILPHRCGGCKTNISKNDFGTKTADEEEAELLQLQKEREAPKLSPVDQLSKEELDEICNVSRLSETSYNKLKHVQKVPSVAENKQLSLTEQRKLFANFGAASGVSPGIMWPLGEELEELKDFESFIRPHTLTEMIAAEDSKRKDDEMRMQKRHDEVEAAMRTMPDLIEKYKEKMNKKEMEKKKAIDNRQRLIEKVQDILGYSVGVRDPRFREVLSEAAEEERLEKKRAKKEKKKQQVEARLEKLQNKIVQKKAEAASNEQKEAVTEN